LTIPTRADGPREPRGVASFFAEDILNVREVSGVVEANAEGECWLSTPNRSPPYWKVF